MRRTLVVGFLLVLFGGVVLWLSRGDKGPKTDTGTRAAQAAKGARVPTPEQAAGGGQPDTQDVVTEKPKDSEYKAVQQVKVDTTTLHIGDPFDYVSYLFKSVNRLGKPQIVPDPDLPGSIIVTHVYVNYDRTILKVQAKRKTRRGPFLICGLWTAPARK